MYCVEGRAKNARPVNKTGRQSIGKILGVTKLKIDLKETESNSDRAIRGEIIIDAPVHQVWEAWITEEGITSFFAPACKIGFRVDGPYEIYFNPDAELGQRGAEGAKIMAYQTEKMLAFTWSTPPHLVNVRKHWTHVVVRFYEIEKGKTKVTLFHDGWGEGKEWDEAFTYFQHAWSNVVLKRLRYRFAAGPVDWENPPKLD